MDQFSYEKNESFNHCFKELLRMNSPLTRSTPRLATRDFKLKDIKVKKGTMIALLITATHKNPKNFKNPNKF